MKKGVKRKADTTTPTANSFDPLFTPTESKSAKISTRRESGRQIKKVVILNFLILWNSLEHMSWHFKYMRPPDDDSYFYDDVVGWYDPIAASTADWGRSPIPPGSTAPHVLQLEQPGMSPPCCFNSLQKEVHFLFCLSYEGSTLFLMAVRRPDISKTVNSVVCWVSPPAGSTCQCVGAVTGFHYSDNFCHPLVTSRTGFACSCYSGAIYIYIYIYIYILFFLWRPCSNINKEISYLQRCVDD